MDWFNSKLAAVVRQRAGRSLLIFFTLVLLAGWLMWLETSSQSSPQIALPKEHGEPEYYLEEAKLKRYNSQGQLFQILDGLRVTHYPEQQLTQIKRPVMQHWSDTGQLWRMSAKQGEMYKDQTIYLENQVVISPINPNSSYTPEFLTQRLWLDSQNQTAQTFDPVVFQSPSGTTEGVGLFATLDQGHVHLLEDVKSQYLAQPPAIEYQDQE